MYYAGFSLKTDIEQIQKCKFKLMINNLIILENWYMYFWLIRLLLSENGVILITIRKAHKQTAKSIDKVCPL